MKRNGIRQESLLEAGLLGLLISIIVGGLVLFGGGFAGLMHRNSGNTSRPPEPGGVTSERHRNIANNSAR